MHPRITKFAVELLAEVAQECDERVIDNNSLDRYAPISAELTQIIENIAECQGTSQKRSS